MKKQTLILGFAALLSLPLTALADIYRWKDANGVLHFSNQPPPDGVSIIEKIEEAPFDPEADRRRIEEERRLRLERQKMEIDARQAETDLREREAQLKLEDANRRLEEARSLEQEARQRAKPDDCDDDYYLRYGVCLGYSARGIRRPHPGPAPPSDIYRGYYRDNNNLYYKAPRKPGPPPRERSPKRSPASGAPSTKKPAPSGQPLQGAEELLPKEAPPTPARPAASK